MSAVLVIFGIFVVVTVITAIAQGPEGRAKAAAARNARLQAKRRPISVVGNKTDNGLACPKCGGAQFKARRSTKARVGVVATGMVGAAATRKTQVQCVTCGTKYGRG